MLVEYKGLHFVCFECGQYGHRSADCPRLCKAAQQERVDQEDRAREATELPDSSISPNDSMYGPWMVAANHRRLMKEMPVGPRQAAIASSASG